MITIIISYLLIKDTHKILRFMSITTIISGYIVIIFNSFLRIIINQKIPYINIAKITNIIYEKAINRGLILIFIGAIELIIYVLITLYKKYYMKKAIIYRY